MDIQEIKELLKQNKIRWSTHCLERMQDREIYIKDVKNCIMTGEVIEDYPDDYPHPSCLVFGYTLGKVILHVVVGNDSRQIYIITAYYPSTEKFKDDLKTRREE